MEFVAVGGARRVEREQLPRLGIGQHAVGPEQESVAARQRPAGHGCDPVEIEQLAVLLENPAPALAADDIPHLLVADSLQSLDEIRGRVVDFPLQTARVGPSLAG